MVLRATNHPCHTGRGSLYGENQFDAVWCDMVAGAAADFAETALQAALLPTHEQAVRALQNRIEKFGPRFEARLLANKSGFTSGSRLSFADVVLAQATTAYLEISDGILDSYPLLHTHQKQVCKHPGLAGYLQSDLCHPAPGDDYVISTARTPVLDNQANQLSQKEPGREHGTHQAPETPTFQNRGRIGLMAYSPERQVDQKKDRKRHETGGLRQIYQRQGKCQYQNQAGNQADGSGRCLATLIENP